ncbi:hypothetical protein V6N13_034222 [Hibiscus sabdariffa]
MHAFSFVKPLSNSRNGRRLFKSNNPSVINTCLLNSIVDTLEMVATIVSFISKQLESSNHTSTRTTPCATTIITFLSSSWRKHRSESMVEFFDLVVLICNRVIKFLNSTRIASFFEEDVDMTPSWRTPLRIKISLSEICQFILAKTTSRLLYVLSFPLVKRETKRRFEMEIWSSSSAAFMVDETNFSTLFSHLSRFDD